MYKISVFSRHPSHRILRTNLPKLSVRSLVRLGSTTTLQDGKNRIEINSADAVKISANKRLMKERFDAAGCATAIWTVASSVKEILEIINDEDSIKFPIVAKSCHGSRGIGNTLIQNEDELRDWAKGREFSHYIFENYVSYLLEYRLHVTKNGCFYTCRKALIKTTQQSERWRRHKDNCVWLLESNPDFNKPDSWNDIVNDCVKALKEIGADVLSFDVKVQNRIDKEGKKRDYQYFILIECNSASSLGNPNGEGLSVCAQKYLEIIPKLIKDKTDKI